MGLRAGGLKNKKIVRKPIVPMTTSSRAGPPPSNASDSRLHSAWAWWAMWAMPTRCQLAARQLVGNVGNQFSSHVVGNVGHALTSHVVGNVGNRAQSRVVGHVGNVVIEKKSARLQQCKRCTLYAVYPYSLLFFLTINRNHDPHCPQLHPRPMFSGLCAWAICPHSMTHTMTHNAHTHHLGVVRRVNATVRKYLTTFRSYRQ